ncbi:MAG: hypothetical protein HZA05_05170 [Nitrospirae bacterium]|nr:hypothetical protein [Nitrospirota bacterium]
MHILLKKIIFSLITFTAIIVSLTGIGVCGELVPVEPPSKFENQSQGKERSKNSQQTVDSSVYKDFERKVSGMNSQEKDKLRNAIKQKRDSAITNKSWEEVTHYKKLLDIMGK